MGTPVTITGAEVLTAAGFVQQDVTLERGRVTTIGTGLRRGDVLDAGGLLLAPGFVDLQCNGAHGIDLAAEPERLWELAARLPRDGVTGFLPTIVSAPRHVVERAQATLRRGRGPVPVGATPLGLHLEGPMLAPDRRGAHPAERLHPPDRAVYGTWSRATGVAMVTLAPELPGALAAVRHLTAAGVVVAAGHTMASSEEMLAGVETGIRAVTHLFNAMAPFDHRAPGPVGVALADRRLVAGILVDGVHLHPVTVAAAWAALGPRRTAVVSDSVAARGLGPGRHRLGGTEVVVADGAARRPDGRLAGSVTPLDAAVRNLMAWTGCGPADAVATVTSTPARLLGLTAAVAPGAAADLVLLTPDLHVAATLVGGRVVHRAR